ncbi:MAG TPA: DUF1127 domain-containing protein [Burkholderiaceae bacterium]|nr:DUF1127 domain-containing protein [Burkholderiaceae bacterium]
MRYSIHSQLMPDGPLPAESFGRIARCAPVPRPISGAATRSANEANINSREPNEALALRAVVANGFGDAVIDRADAYAHVAAVPVPAAARMQRARAIGQSIAGAARRLASILDRLVADYHRHSLERATGRALAELDARALRDIGLDRSEIRSVAREIAQGRLTPGHSMNAGRPRP